MTDSLASKEIVPPTPPDYVRWLYKRGGEIVAIEVDYVMTGVDTSKTVWHLKLADGSKSTIDESGEFSSYLDFYPHQNVPKWRALACLKESFRKMCEERDKYEKANAREIADYKRLKAKFEGAA